MLRATAAAAALLASIAVHAQDALSYKGLPLGASQDDFLKQFPDYRCAGRTCIYNHSDCVGILSDVSPAGLAARDDRARSCSERNSFGGQDIEHGSATFLDGKLGTLYFAFRTTQASALIDAATQRYGKPDEVSEEPFRTQGGGVYPNLRARWLKGGSRMTITANSGRLGQGSASLMSPEAISKLEDDMKSKSQKGAKDF